MGHKTGSIFQYPLWCLFLIHYRVKVLLWWMDQRDQAEFRQEQNQQTHCKPRRRVAYSVLQWKTPSPWPPTLSLASRHTRSFPHHRSNRTFRGLEGSPGFALQHAWTTSCREVGLSTWFPDPPLTLTLWKLLMLSGLSVGVYDIATLSFRINWKSQQERVHLCTESSRGHRLQHHALLF